jgi:hypothetical protein
MRTEDVSAKDSGLRQWQTLVLVLATIVEAATTRVVAVAGLSSLFPPSTPMGVQGVARVVVVAEAVMYRG